MKNALTDLAAEGVSVWLDDLSRSRIRSGNLARMVEEGEIVGITTNPTIFAKAIGSAEGYEDQIRNLALRATPIGDALRSSDGVGPSGRLATSSARWSIGRPGADGRVSIEVDARLSGEAERTAAEARGLWWLAVFGFAPPVVDKSFP